MPVDTWKKANNRVKYGPAPYKGGKRYTKAHWLPDEPKGKKGKKKRIRFDTKLWFGIHKGQSIRLVMKKDMSYLRWLVSNQEVPGQPKMNALKRFLKSVPRLWR